MSKSFENPLDKVNDYELLSYVRQKFGNVINVAELIKQRYKDLHKCPQCNGLGYVVEEYNAYPHNLPDSGWVYQPGFRKSECDLCKGVGFTKEEFVPNIVQQGWKKKQ